MNEAVLIEAHGLKKHFPISKGIVFSKKRGAVKAVDGVDFKIPHGATFGLVGESGCGKTTIATLLLLLDKPTGGWIEFEGKRLASLGGADLRCFRTSVQAVLQDPFNSLSPRMRVRDIIAEPLVIVKKLGRNDIEARVNECLELVGLERRSGNLFPHEFSGGQAQRIAIARALASKPRLVVLDEPVASLDVSTRGQVLNLLKDLQQRLGVAYVLISHDLASVKYMGNDMAVMYLGSFVEEGGATQIFSQPMHPYTRALIAAAFYRGPQDRTEDEEVLAGEVPNPINPPAGCRFHPRCRYQTTACSTLEPLLKEVSDGHLVACHRV